MDGLDGIDYLQKMLLYNPSRFWIIATGEITWEYLNSISDIEADCGGVFCLPKLQSLYSVLKSHQSTVLSSVGLEFAVLALSII